MTIPVGAVIDYANTVCLLMLTYCTCPLLPLSIVQPLMRRGDERHQ